MANGRIWTEEDIQLIRDNTTMPVRLLAEKLGRSEAATSMARSRFTRDIPRRQGVISTDFDKRPSGWYEETIGILLLEFPDAMEMWRHYHRYVKVEYVDTEKSWVTLRCYRDADAP